MLFKKKKGVGFCSCFPNSIWQIFGYFFLDFHHFFQVFWDKISTFFIHKNPLLPTAYLNEISMSYSQKFDKAIVIDAVRWAEGTARYWITVCNYYVLFDKISCTGLLKSTRGDTAKVASRPGWAAFEPVIRIDVVCSIPWNTEFTGSCISFVLEI